MISRQLLLILKETMPVEDSEPNALNTCSTSRPYGCKDRVIKDGYYMDSREYAEDGTFTTVQKFVPHTMSTTCRFDGAMTDPRCSTCSHRHSAVEYDREIRARGN